MRFIECEENKIETAKDKEKRLRTQKQSHNKRNKYNDTYDSSCIILKHNNNNSIALSSQPTLHIDTTINNNNKCMGLNMPSGNAQSPARVSEKY